MIIWADRWFWIDVANILLGANQALAWSMTVIMKVDLVGPKRRGLALGLNEFAGYLSVGIMAWLTGYIGAVYGLRPQPFYLGIGIAAAGLIASVLFVRETIDYAHYEARRFVAQARANPTVSELKGGTESDPASAPDRPPSLWEIFRLTTWKERALSACSQAGLVNNLNDGMSWGIYPLYFASYGLGVAPIGIIKAIYPATWGVLQLLTGPLSDRSGRKWLITGGMMVQAVGIWITVLLPSYGWWVFGAVLQGLGTAMVYPVLLAAISDVASPLWRASSMGVYRLWRDLGYALGALLAGVIADAIGMAIAIHVIAALTLLSGIVVAVRMYETHRAAA
jgi:MFS family permease